MTTHICPICSGDRNADMTRIKQRLWTIGITEESVDPGGRQLTLADGRVLRVLDQCNACDIIAIERLLEDAP